MSDLYERAIRPRRGPQPGTVALRRQVLVVYPSLGHHPETYGIWNARRIAGSSAWSLHAEGRAIDFGVPEEERGDGGDGWRAACALVASAPRTGVQRVIWQRHIWSIDNRASNWQELHSGDAHLDHIHVEQRWAWADGRRAVNFTP